MEVERRKERRDGVASLMCERMKESVFKVNGNKDAVWKERCK